MIGLLLRAFVVIWAAYTFYLLGAAIYHLCGLYRLTLRLRDLKLSVLEDLRELGEVGSRGVPERRGGPV